MNMKIWIPLLILITMLFNIVLAVCYEPSVDFPLVPTSSSIITTSTSTSSSSSSSSSSTRTSSIPPDPPGNISNVTFETIAGGIIIVKWDNPMEPSFDYVEIYRSTEGGLTEPGTSYIYRGMSNAYTDMGLEDNTTYYYTFFVYSTLDNTYIDPPVTESITSADTTLPVVESTSPVNYSIDNAIDTSIVFTFSEAVIQEPITITLFPAHDIVASWLGDMELQLTPTMSWNSLQEYTIKIKNFQDVHYNKQTEYYTLSFTTIDDTTQPTVLATAPTNAATDVPFDSIYTITFSETMDDSVGSVGFSPVNSNILSWDPTKTIATVTPDTPFVNSSETPYTVNLTGFQDKAGNSLTGTTSFSFTTLADTQTPDFISSTPLDETSNVNLNTPLVLTFNEYMNSAAGSIDFVYAPVATITVNESWNTDFTEVTLTPDPFWPNNTLVTYTLNGLTDWGANTLNGDPITQDFSTVNDTTAPSVDNISPEDTETDVPLDSLLTIVFTEIMNTGVGTVIITPDPGGTGTWDDDLKTWNYQPATYWSANTPYTVELSGFEDAALIALTGTTSFGFTTLDDVDPPEVSATTPIDTATDVITETYTITFDEQMNTYTGSITMTPDIVGKTVDWNSGGDELIISWDLCDLASDTAYTVDLVGYQDLAGNALTGTTSFGFQSSLELTPTITTSIPAEGELDVSVNTNVLMFFNKALDPTGATVSISPNAGGLSATLAPSGENLAVQLHGILYGNQTYTLTINNLNDYCGRPLTPNTLQFTTAQTEGGPWNSDSGLVWEDITGTGTDLTFASSNAATAVNFPGDWVGGGTAGTFIWQGEEFSDVYVGVNGYISFGTPYSTKVPGDPYPDIGNNRNNDIGAYVCDLDLPSTCSGHAKYEIQGASPDRVLIISLSTKREYPTSCSGTFIDFQFQLFETSNDIAIVYGTNFSTDSAFNAGWENKTSTSGYPLLFYDGSSYLYGTDSPNLSFRYKAP